MMGAGTDEAMRHVHVLWVLLLLPAGCPGGGDDDDSTAELALDPCGFAEQAWATVDVSEQMDIYHDEPFARIGARVQDGRLPEFHRIALEEGACRTLEVAPGDCDPACPYDEFCTVDDECVPYPAGISGGTLTLTGLGDPIEIEPEEWNAGEYVGPFGMDADLFAAGETIGASFVGAEFPSVSLAAAGVAPLDPALTLGGFTMEDGQDAVASWTPGGDENACIQLLLNGSNSVHGAPLADIIWCEGPDTGSLIVPRTLVEAFPYGQTPEITAGHDWPLSELTRYTRATRTTDGGDARLTVRATSYFRHDHPEPGSE
jgi:hypothetical protein